MNHKITAHLESGEKIRVSIPHEQWAETTTGHRQTSTGNIRIGLHIGRRWGIVHNYSIWAKPDGTVYGDSYTAYDLRDKIDYFRFIEEINSVNCADTLTGLHPTDIENYF